MLVNRPQNDDIDLERIAPTRADIEAELGRILKPVKGAKKDLAKERNDARRLNVKQKLLVDRGVPPHKHDRILSDLPSYEGWEDDGEPVDFGNVYFREV